MEEAAFEQASLNNLTSLLSYSTREEELMRIVSYMMINLSWKIK